MAKTACGEFAFFPAFCLSRQASTLGLSLRSRLSGAGHCMPCTACSQTTSNNQAIQSANNAPLSPALHAAFQVLCGIPTTWATPPRGAAAAPRRRQRQALEWWRWGPTQATACGAPPATLPWWACAPPWASPAAPAWCLCAWTGTQVGVGCGVVCCGVVCCAVLHCTALCCKSAGERHHTPIVSLSAASRPCSGAHGSHRGGCCAGV